MLKTRCHAMDEGTDCCQCGEPLPLGVRTCKVWGAANGHTIRYGHVSAGLGDWIARLLTGVGLSKEHWRRLWGKCGCDGRQSWFNELGRWLRRIWVRGADRKR
jgi:hypothetical protein